ncbi:MAG: zinc ABC transporter substrate-binding protein [Ardenticatenaceae bacterium]|nr:zinc ABC transporter substrate-binding protein [Anaerolineales bacterium]MCB8923468.1 zinc ABC transporter substrate-binding protein [Ardenticatenaceae bacterium]MCB8991377.1 zinc ABC transporter substrate-binding protein [Ardenticatenaceae bacterium]MCB9003807.1 zinc ABC transporter substrate-binding protein [Ardenticatenaceae bacterium]
MKQRDVLKLFFILLLLIFVGCSSTTNEEDHEGEDALAVLSLPQGTAVSLNGRPLNVIATTSIIGDVVGNVGGEAINLTTLMQPGQDPHSYQPAAAELTQVAQADVIFVNGWDLEEGLVNDLASIGENVLIVPVSANIEPLAFGAAAHDDHEEEAPVADEHDHTGADPHAWFSVGNVEQWTRNIETTLSSLDPENTAVYSAHAEQYLAELADLNVYAQEQLTAVPAERRVLVTNHGAFGYFAHDYDFEMLGTVIPGLSTLAEPSANDLTELVNAMRSEGVCAIFTETTLSDQLAQTVANELDSCEQVQVIPLYTGSIGPAGSGADSYIGMFHANVDAIVQGLK